MTRDAYSVGGIPIDAPYASLNDNNDAQDASIPKFTKKHVEWLKQAVPDLRIRADQIAASEHLYEQWLFYQGMKHVVDIVEQAHISSKDKR